MSRFGIRTRLEFVVVAAVAAAVAVLLIGFNLILANSLDRSSRDLLRQRATAQLSFLKSTGGQLSLVDVPDAAGPDANVWVYSGSRLIEQPRAGARARAAALALSTGPQRFLDLNDSDTRLFSKPVIVDGRRVGTVVVASALAPYEATRTVALVGSLVLGGLVLVLVGLAAHWLLASSLRPVQRMTRQAATWSERDLDQRFALGKPRDELTELAATLDGLLDRLAASLRREQRFSAELSHELRTPIARVIAETELALRRDRSPEDYRAALEVVHRSAELLSRIVDALVAAARIEAGPVKGTADAYEVAAEATAACAGLAAERDVLLDVEQPAQPVRLGVDPDLAERILQPVVENACRYGAKHVHVSIERRDSTVRYAVTDDGPGVDDDESDRIFEPGVRGRIGEASASLGAGLGLALARRLARSVTGDVEAVAVAQGGRFLVRLPAA
ncbi:MAG TPA: ATP-binding protein [Gaiellaceae bacterium]|nr:ATP-binding protein [Gaiellaceae bacterium]